MIATFKPKRSMARAALFSAVACRALVAAAAGDRASTCAAGGGGGACAAARAREVEGVELLQQPAATGDRRRELGGHAVRPHAPKAAPRSAPSAAKGRAIFPHSAAHMPPQERTDDGPREFCEVGDVVKMPGLNAYCAGEQCCPPLTPGGPTFPCPSAPPGWGAGHCGTSVKEVDCLRSLNPEPAPSPPGPAPAPQPAPPPPSTPQGSKLVIVNACEDPVWIASMVPDDVRDDYPNNHKLEHQQSVTFEFPAERTIASTRFWAKMNCNEHGLDCAMGTSGGPGQGPCPPEGCAPPVDSKFEATFWDFNTASPVDWWDTSGVDGYTLPYKLELDSNCPQGVPLDCSELRFADCPTNEVLNGEEVDLRVYHGTGDVVGCYSTCGKLTYSNWGNTPVFGPADEEAQMYCCPTPPVSSEQCREGPVEQSQYVKLFREKCMGVYSYAYDDAIGLQTCPVGTTYTWTLYCPA